ncbi:hypothetical protein [Candidatus Amarolinea dominans]|uniref:hypothetical protein n=1 Tax=Candidatus Amarolinea dominans TaxID=3140696 RepID=UPI001D73A871|nr:hypothetical protein [Anaerolineae bacterium]
MSPPRTDRYHFIRGVGWFSFSNHAASRPEPGHRSGCGQTDHFQERRCCAAPGGVFHLHHHGQERVGYPLTGLVIQDTVPAATTFAYALDGGSKAAASSPGNASRQPGPT